MVGFIGAGNMAEAILSKGLNAGALKASETCIYDISAGRSEEIGARYGVNKLRSARELAEACRVIILAVKPHIMAGVIAEIKDCLNGKAVISIAAAWPHQKLRDALGEGTRVLRVMPNTPAMVGEGMSALAVECTLDPAEKAFAEDLFGALGRVMWVEDRLMNAVTCISGSGPAYAFIFIEALADAGVLAGLSRAQAYELAGQTLLGASRMVLDSGKAPAVLKDEVCSAGGTTIEAVRALEKAGLRAAVMDGALAAYEKAEKLSKL